MRRTARVERTLALGDLMLMRESARHVFRARFLKTRVAAQAGTVVVTERDMTDSDCVLALFDRCTKLLREGTRHVVIDLHHVEAADTKLLACIVAIYQMARSSSARLEVCLSNAVREVARICRLEWLTTELGAGQPRQP